ncbi:MAG: hypothetical protein AABZ12_15145 [Planctomycetota bacterium]
MRRLNGFALSLAGLGLLAFVASPVWAHCGKCAGDCATMAKEMDAGKSSLASAVGAAETASKGKAVAASAGLKDGKLTYNVYCSSGGKLQGVPVDAAGKAGQGKDEKSALGSDAATSEKMVKAMETGKLTLASAMSAAETSSKGKAMAVVSSLKGEALTMNVYCLVGDKIMKVDVDSAGKAGRSEEAKMLPGNEEKPKPKPGG